MTDQYGSNHFDDGGPYNEPKTQETQVNETEELPAVSKLREAFDTARNALIEGS